MMALAPTVVLTSVSGSRLLVVQLILTQGAHTVSYTHLDVYKRQPLLTPVAAVMNGVSSKGGPGLR